jgi:ATP-dependent helicase/nuclease subunit A
VTRDQADHAAQDELTRVKIREALDETLFVEAGAGTGKTRALVDRVVALVLAGRPIDRIVAITFTEKAAAELKDRVRGQLEASLAAEPDNGKLVREALASLDRAQISTIHAFGQALLRSFGAEAGIDPAFVVLDEVLADRRLQERWRTYLEGLAEDRPAVAAIDRALGLGLTTRDLETLARELTARAHLASRLAESPLPAPAPVWPDLEEMRRELHALPLDAAPPDDKLRPRIDALLALVESLAGAGPEREAVLASGAGILGRSYNAGRADAWGGKAVIEQVRETAAAISERLQETLAACRAEALADLMPSVVRFIQEDTLARGQEGTLTFDDLILGPRDLLRANPDAARALRDRFDALLIDEFQDTDPLQVDIAGAFATDPDTGALEAARLFLVGDPKQSIYRFRRADMAIYSNTRQLIAENGGDFPVLALSRRSRPQILDWVNAVFAGVIGEGSNPTIQPPYRPIHPHRSDELEGPGVAWLGGEMEGMKAREVRQYEAAAVAAQCRAVLEEGWEVAERDGAIRKAKFRDIAILIPRRAILPALERSLADAGIPYRVEGGSLIYRTQEVRDLINCLTAIDDPADEVAIVGALRSTAFACSDVDLARYRAAGGRFNYLASDLKSRDGAVAEALRTLASYHAVRHQYSLTALVEGFVADRGQVEIGILDQADRNTFRRMRYMVEQARAFEASGPESLRAFVSWLERRTTDQILDHEGAGLDDDEDAVRVLTIHGAKGLEFPIVFVAGLSASPNKRPPVYGVDYAEDRIAVSIGSKSRSARFQLGPADEVNAVEEEHASAEFDRLLYVASTRARDHLVLFLYHPSREKQCGARRLIEAGACEWSQPRPELPAAEHVPAAPFADLNVDPPRPASTAEFAAARQAMVERGRRQRYTSATALGPLKKDEARDESEPWARGRGGTRLGRAVHAAIQSLPLDADEAMIEAFSRAQAVAEAIPDRSGEVARLVRQALQSDAAARARAAPRALREVSFAAEFDGVILEGFADLIIETADGIEIVDWKTDDIPAAAVRERLREYELQAGLYVLGIESATGRPVTRVTYVFARAGLEESPGEPASLSARARAQLASVGT